MTDLDPVSFQQAQIDGITDHIPEVIVARIANGTALIDRSGVAAGLRVGVRAPDFTLPDALGRPVSSVDLRADGPLVVTFYRGEWCPFCNVQLRSLQEALPRLHELGATLVAVSPQAPDHSLSITEKHDLAFPVLSDVDQATIRADDVQFTLEGDLEDLQVNVFGNDPAKQNADGSRSLPVPATFVLDRDGLVVAAFVSADWRVRARPRADRGRGPSGESMSGGR